ncbi:hypothetical protein COT97_02820 [Candidatus Falkowbacteria bacterium CG10_big_fil_rev_8_21_14_0_10_39_11]|uniref:Uncharacterized protein n=1 Tax=Candidatus Falkowbacteria bacterium CG10_big_fil_rev_8_21_14_0_10_39_11 TaxID=1974565 RepID=A0A2H0V4X5_9BACT|nr:MAG: hypothetical protein COT97_02820 [Candidatus Falkowbacteria bacterium CG10_big_fil_rev_8_21_14_0_10_39_11]
MSFKHKDFQDWLAEVNWIVTLYDLAKKHDLDWYQMFRQRLQTYRVCGPIERYMVKKHGECPNGGLLTPDNPTVQKLEAIAAEIRTCPAELRVRQLVREAYETVRPDISIQEIIKPGFLQGTTTA